MIALGWRRGGGGGVLTREEMAGSCRVQGTSELKCYRHVLLFRVVLSLCVSPCTFARANRVQKLMLPATSNGATKLTGFSWEAERTIRLDFDSSDPAGSSLVRKGVVC